MTDAGRAACAECGMVCNAGEYHPYAACLMFKQCRNSETVRANLQAVRQRGKVEGIQESKNLVSEFIEAWLLAGMVAKLLTPAVHEAVGGLSRDLRRELQKIEQAAQDEKGLGMERYIIVERYADNGELSHRALVDSTDGRELGTDGGEPEDQSLWRDWAWVPDELNKAQATVEALQAQVKRHQTTTYCAFCGQTYDLDTGAELIARHIKECPKHPMRDVEQQVEALQRERDRLAELVRQAQPHVCSLLCPSVKARHELWTHTKLCLNMQAALTPAGGGKG